MNAQKSWSVETAPRILMVDFVRSVGFGGKKNTDIIPYPKKFNLKNYMSEAIDRKSGARSSSDQHNLKDVIYDLFAVIVHEGRSTHSGHYYCYCRAFEEENAWYKCNDHQITKLSGIEGALGKQAYILFYQKRDQQANSEFNQMSMMILQGAVKQALERKTAPTDLNE